MSRTCYQCARTYVIDKVCRADQGNVGTTSYGNRLIQNQIAAGRLQQHASTSRNAVRTACGAYSQRLIIGKAQAIGQICCKGPYPVGIGQHGRLGINQQSSCLDNRTG